MRDRVLAYALAASVGVHIVILCAIGINSAAKRIHAEEPELIQVEVVKYPDEPEPKPEPVIETPKPVVRELDPATAPRRVAVPQKPSAAPQPEPKPAPKAVQSRPQVESPANTPRPKSTASSHLPGNPGGDINLGSGSSRGENLGGSGGTPTGWVPGAPGGTGVGSGSGPGAGRPEPVPDAKEGPGREPAPKPTPPPDVYLKVCAESGGLPGRHCERTVTRSFRPGAEPTGMCSVCRPKHVSTLADRSTPELVSGAKRPKYPASARERGVEGSVTVEYTINPEGNVVNIKVHSSSGSDDLDRAAVDAVRGRKYKPAVQGGIPRNYRKRETFHFKLD